MNKSELIAKIVADTGLSRKKATSAVESVLAEIESALERGESVRLVGFGTFSVAQRKATTGRNPRTGSTIQIPATKRPKFKAGKNLKAAVAESEGDWGGPMMLPD